MAKRRVHLSFPGSLADEPVMWQLSELFELSYNIRQADYVEGLGWMMVELEGEYEELERGIKWLEEKGVHVDPIEQDVVH